MVQEGRGLMNEIPSYSDSWPPSPAGTLSPPLPFSAAGPLDDVFAAAVAVAGAFGFEEALELLAAGALFLDLDFTVAAAGAFFAMAFPFPFPLNLVRCLLSRSLAFSSSEVPSV